MRFHLHLVSDATGETVHSLARAALAQFEDAEAIEHIWSMVRTRSQIERVIAGIDANPGVVFFTLVNDTLRQPLQECCRRLSVPAVPVLDSAIANAEHNHELVGDELHVTGVYADEGPTLKRFRPRAMGRATPIHKRTSHLTIMLGPKE